MALETEAIGAAVEYVAKKERSEAEVRRHLASKGFCPESIEAAIGRLRQRGFVDDRRVAGRLANGSSLIGPNKIRAKLAGRGVGDAEIDAAVASIDEAGQRSAIATLLDKRGFGTADRVKAYRFLIARGFEEALVQSELESKWGSFDAE